MSANSSITLTNLDFASNKDALKTYLKEQSSFKDFDFEGSNMSVLLDILSYNTYHNAFYLNMIGNEMFLDSAKLRDSVVSHAKELNYLPRSFSSATAAVNVTITATDSTKQSLVIPKGTSFFSKVENRNYSFVTNESNVLTSSNGVFTSNLTLYEGSYVNETYLIDYDSPLIFKLNNKTADVSSITVSVIEDNGANTYSYLRATSLFDLNATSKVFFVQPASADSYEILFGDGVIGRKPKNKSIVVVEYRVCNGELPNGAKKFVNSGRIDSEANVIISTITSAADGTVAESLDSIKFNAPRAFTTQERAITTEDYENLLKINFAEINAVTAYGGEDVTPPQYGRVFVSVDLNDVDGLPDFKREEYGRFLKSRSTVSMEPVFISPDYIYVGVNTNIKYNINLTGLNPQDIRSFAIGAITDYSAEKLNNFNKTLRYSKLVNEIDNAEVSILSNETSLRLIKYIAPVLNQNMNFTVDFKIPLTKDGCSVNDEHSSSAVHAVYSTPISFSGRQNCRVEDDGDGNLIVVEILQNMDAKISTVGTVNYDTGLLQLSNFKIGNYDGSALKFFAIPANKDIVSSQNVILNIAESDITITIEEVRE